MTKNNEKSKRIVLAIDPGIANTGWATNTGLSGTIITDHKTPLSKRICEVTYTLKKLTSSPPPDQLVVENTFGALMIPTTMLLGGLMAVFSDAEFLFVSPTKWLYDIFGSHKKGQYKNLTKELVSNKLGLKYKTQHQADALGILHWYENYSTKKKGKRHGSTRKNCSNRRRDPRVKLEKRRLNGGSCK